MDTLVGFICLILLTLHDGLDTKTHSPSQRPRKLSQANLPETNSNKQVEFFHAVSFDFTLTLKTIQEMYNETQDYFFSLWTVQNIEIWQLAKSMTCGYIFCWLFSSPWPLELKPNSPFSGFSVASQWQKWQCRDLHKIPIPGVFFWCNHNGR